MYINSCRPTTSTEFDDLYTGLPSFCKLRDYNCTAATQATSLCVQWILPRISMHNFALHNHVFDLIPADSLQFLIVRLFARAHKFICTTIKCVQVPRSHFIIGVAFRLLFYGFIYCCPIILLLLGALLKFCVHKQPPQTFNFRIHIFKKWDCEWQIFVTIFISRINFAAFNFRGTRFF